METIFIDKKLDAKLSKSVEHYIYALEFEGVVRYIGTGLWGDSTTRLKRHEQYYRGGATSDKRNDVRDQVGLRAKMKEHAVLGHTFNTRILVRGLMNDYSAKRVESNLICMASKYHIYNVCVPSEVDPDEEVNLLCAGIIGSLKFEALSQQDIVSVYQQGVQFGRVSQVPKESFLNDDFWRGLFDARARVSISALTRYPLLYIGSNHVALLERCADHFKDVARGSINNTGGGRLAYSASQAAKLLAHLYRDHAPADRIKDSVDTILSKLDSYRDTTPASLVTYNLPEYTTPFSVYRMSCGPDTLCVEVQANGRKLPRANALAYELGRMGAGVEAATKRGKTAVMRWVASHGGPSVCAFKVIGNFQLEDEAEALRSQFSSLLLNRYLKSRLLLVSGSFAAGKSWVCGKVSESFGIPYVSWDESKTQGDKMELFCNRIEQGLISSDFVIADCWIHSSETLRRFNKVSSLFSIVEDPGVIQERLAQRGSTNAVKGDWIEKAAGLAVRAAFSGTSSQVYEKIQEFVKWQRTEPEQRSV